MSACHSPRIALHDFGSLPWAVPSWHCHLRCCNLCVHHPETAKLLTAPLLSDLWVWTPVIHTPPAPRHASQHLQCQGGSQVPPGDACPLTEQPWPCATGRRWRSHSLWWKRCHCPNCSYNQKTLKRYCLPWKGWSPAKLLRLPYSLLAQIWGVLWSPSSSALILQRRSHVQAGKTPWVSVGTINIFPWEQEESLCTALLPQSRGLWRSMIYRPLAIRETAVGSWLINKFLQEQISMWPITDLQIIWNTGKVETCDVRKDEV